jgi:hypothetical protein
MANDYFDTAGHGAVNRHIYNLIRGNKRTSADELGDMLSAIVTEANPAAGLIFDVGRAALSKNDDDE